MYNLWKLMHTVPKKKRYNLTLYSSGQCNIYPYVTVIQEQP